MWQEGFVGLVGGRPSSSRTPAQSLRPTSAPRWSTCSVAGVPAASVGACGRCLSVSASLWMLPRLAPHRRSSRGHVLIVDAAAAAHMNEDSVGLADGRPLSSRTPAHRVRQPDSAWLLPPAFLFLGALGAARAPAWYVPPRRSRMGASRPPSSRRCHHGASPPGWAPHRRGRMGASPPPAPLFPSCPCV